MGGKLNTWRNAPEDSVICVVDLGHREACLVGYSAICKL